MDNAQALFWLEMNWQHIAMRQQWGNLEAEQIFAALWSQSKNDPIRRFRRSWRMTDLLRRRIEEYITIHRSVPFRIVTLRSMPITSVSSLNT